MRNRTLAWKLSISESLPLGVERPDEVIRNSALFIAEKTAKFQAHCFYEIPQWLGSINNYTIIYCNQKFAEN